MTNRISDLQQHELFTAQAKEAVDEAADRMNWHQVGTFRSSGPASGRHPHRAGPHRRHRPGRGPGDDPVSGPGTSGAGVIWPDSELAKGQMGWPRGGFYTARRVDRLLFGQTGPAPPSWFPTDNGRWR